MVKEQKKRTLSLGSMWVYAFGIFGMQLMVGYINSYQSQFYSSIFGADLMIVAAIILVAKIVSAIADPFIGNMIDRSHFKSGKMKPFIMISSFPFAVITTIMFVAFDFPNKIGMYVYITVITILWNIAMSFADIPGQGLLSLLSPDAEERNAAAGIMNTLKSIALAAPSVVVPVICVLTKSPGGIIGEKEYLISALFFSILGLVLYAQLFFTSKELVSVNPESKMGLREMVRELKENKMLLIVFLTFMLGFGRNMAMGIGVQSAAILIKNGISLDIGSFHYEAAGENLPWLLGITAAVSSMTSIVVVPFINRKWGEKKTFIVFALYGFVTTTLSFILYVIGVPALRSLAAILVMNMISSFAFGPHGYLPPVMVSDIVDYREWKTGKRTEGVQFAVLSLSIKISNALSVAVGIFIIGAAGYYGGMPAEAITDKMQNICWAAYLFVPGICMLLSAIPMLFYKIDFKTKEEMRAAILANRNAEK